MKSQRGFTLVELLVVIAVLAILAAILFPVFTSAKERGQSASCAANLGQIATAMTLYSVDSDDRTPSPTLFRLGTPNHHLNFDTGIGWAGKITPYLKTTKCFQCPDDASQVATANELPGSVKVSYSANDNILNQQIPQLSGSRTVLFFEVSKSAALVTQTDEGMNPRPTTYLKMSSSGNGIAGDILESLVINPVANIGGLDVVYATGHLSNSANDVLWDNFVGDGRHQDGSNFAAVDTHVIWAKGDQVSAGSNAIKPTDSQTPTGCFIPPATSGTNLPCAEGLDKTDHKLTFSLN